MKLFTLLSFLSLSFSICASELKIALNPEDTNIHDAIIIQFPQKVTVDHGQTSIRYRILNRSSKDIFAVIRSKNVNGWNNLELNKRKIAGGGSSLGKFSSHAELRLLRSPRRLKDGTVEDVVTSRSYAEAKVECGGGGRGDLSDWIGAKGSLKLWVTYYVPTGPSGTRRVDEMISVPVEIVLKKAEQVAAPDG